MTLLPFFIFNHFKHILYCFIFQQASDWMRVSSWIPWGGFWGADKPSDLSKIKSKLGQNCNQLSFLELQQTICRDSIMAILRITANLIKILSSSSYTITLKLGNSTYGKGSVTPVAWKNKWKPPINSNRKNKTYWG